MADLPKLFISHSSDDAELTEAVRDALNPPGADDRFDLLLDIDRLQPGWAWEPFLHEWMAVCDAELLSLTESAVESHYVLKEATILAWRMSRDPDFSGGGIAGSCRFGSSAAHR